MSAGFLVLKSGAASPIDFVGKALVRRRATTTGSPRQRAVSTPSRTVRLPNVQWPPAQPGIGRTGFTRLPKGHNDPACLFIDTSAPEGTPTDLVRAAVVSCLVLVSV